MSNIAVIGVGYVGLVTGVSLADMGNRVICVDVDEEKTDSLRRGVVPIFEPGLEEMLTRNREAGRIHFTTSYDEALQDAEFVFIAVGTPSGALDEADLGYVKDAARRIGATIRQPTIIINKSTVPIGTGDLVDGIVRSQLGEDIPFSVVSNPEFLREGSALQDFHHPDRIVLGSSNLEAAQQVAELYRRLNCPLLITDLYTAEMIKYASNAFLATKISFINEIASICEKLGADVKVVAQGMGLDKRIGTAFLDAGVGWGGSCFPKDVKALINMAADMGCHPQLLRSVVEINVHQRRQVLIKLRDGLGGLRDRQIGVLGLAFKPNTDDMRDAPAIGIIRLLHSQGARVRAYDPVARNVAERLLHGQVTLCDSAYEAAAEADAVVVVTEWNEFRQLDMAALRESMRHPVLVDGRNMFEPARMRELGFVYVGIGRGYPPSELPPLPPVPSER
ncbi:MAG: UDP-glucose dehydrogenase family protein [Chloroflexota bacterium]